MPTGNYIFVILMHIWTATVIFECLLPKDPQNNEARPTYVYIYMYYKEKIKVRFGLGHFIPPILIRCSDFLHRQSFSNTLVSKIQAMVTCIEKCCSESYLRQRLKKSSKRRMVMGGSFLNNYLCSLFAI